MNDRKNDVPSSVVRAGDVIHVRRKANCEALYRSCIAEAEGTIADWLAYDHDQLKIIVHRLPTAEDISLPVDIGLVVELMSR